MRVFQTNQSRVTIDNLHPCLSYWVIVTAVGCINRVDTSPELIGLFETVDFKLVFTVGDAIHCKTWVVQNIARKISDVENSISSVLNGSRCGMSIPCVANSQFTCGYDAIMINFV